MMNKRQTNNKQTWRVMAAANCTKIKIHPNIMLIFLYQSIVLCPCLALVCLPHCRPSSLLLSIVFLVVRPCSCLSSSMFEKAGVESHLSQHNVDCCVLIHCPLSSFVSLVCRPRCSPLSSLSPIVLLVVHPCQCPSSSTFEKGGEPFIPTSC